MSRARMTQDLVEIVQTNGTARVSQDVIEAVQQWTVGSAPAGSFGAAMSQRVVECVAGVSMAAKMSQDVVEVVFMDTETDGTGTVTRTSYGYAV